MFGFGEKRVERKVPQLKGKELSQLVRDVDVVWMDDHAPSGDCEILHDLAALPPEEAAQQFCECLGETDAVQLADRLDILGIAYGALTESRGIPGGVKAMWRSDYPMVLVNERTAPQYDRAREIAHELGILIYCDHPERDAVANAFAELVRDVFVEITPDSPEISGELRGATSRRNLGSVASRH